MKTFPILVLAASLAFSAVGFAQPVKFPTAWMAVSEKGNCLFKMVPPEVREVEGGQVNIVRQPFGVAYSLSENGELNELWRAEGWYAYEGRISDDGRYLVCLGPRMTNYKDTDTAIAIYEQGRILKEYKVKDLLKKPEAIDRLSDSQVWLPVKQTRPNGFENSGYFHLTMVDKTTYVFDMVSGDIALTGSDPEARSTHELREEEDADVVRKGKELLEKGTFRKAYEEHFVIDGVQALKGWRKSIAEDLVWCAKLTPKSKLAHPAMVEAIFPVREDRVEVSLRPQEMVTALEKALQHPFVEDHFKNSRATCLRLRTLGDRMHFNAKELSAFLKQAKGNEPDDAELKQWIDCVIDLPEPQTRAFHLHLQTGEIIYKEGYEHPPVLVLLDAKGERVGK